MKNKNFILLIIACLFAGILAGLIASRISTTSSSSASKNKTYSLKGRYNELGKVMVLEYHKLAETETDPWTRSYANFQKDLERFHKLGFSLITARDFFCDHKVKIPAGKKPLIITFDDGYRSQLEAVKIMDDFYKKHPDFGRAATFFVYFPAFVRPGSPEAWKTTFQELVAKGYEIGSHTYGHENLSLISLREAQITLAKASAKIKEALGDDYPVETFALPYGAFPKKARFVTLRGRGDYRHNAVFLVGAAPTHPPNHKDYNPLYVQRIQARDDELDRWIKYYQKNKDLFYVSDGNEKTITIPETSLKDLDKFFFTKGTKVRLTHGKKVVKEINLLSKKEITKKKGLAKWGVYLSFYRASIPSFVEETVKKLKKNGGDTIVVDIKDFAGIIGVDVDFEAGKEIGAITPYLKDFEGFVKKMHQKGIRVSARMTVFKDALLAKKRPDLAIQDKTTQKSWQSGGGVYWVDPYSEEVQRYNLELAKAVARAGVDEIQFDYIRFPAREGNLNNCLFRHNKNNLPNYTAIEGFLAKANQALAPYGTIISIDVFGVVAWLDPYDILTTGQRLWEMGKYVDVIYPMIYPSHFDPGFDGYTSPANEPYHFIKEGCLKTINATYGTEVAIMPWIQGFDLRVRNFNGNYIKQQIKATYDSGLSGFFVWNAHNNYAVTWQAFK